jgi:hypothetical protein
MKTFIDDNVLTQETENSENFFETYIPTFVNPDFFMAPPVFETSKEDEAFATQFFSSMFTSTGDQSYSRTSTTVMHNGKVATSTHETFQNGNNFYETQDNNKYQTTSEFYEPVYSQTQAPIDQNVIILDDADEDNNMLFDVFNDIKTFMDLSSGKFTANCYKMQEDSKLSMGSKKISKDRDMSNIRLTNKKPSKKSKA